MDFEIIDIMDTNEDSTSKQDTSVQNISVQNISVQYTSEQDTSEQDTSVQDTIEQDTSMQDTSKQDTVEQGTSEQDTSEQDTVEQDANTNEFNKIIFDFASDLLTTFPELESTALRSIVANDAHAVNHYRAIHEACLSTFPQRFFDILYQNEEIFNGDEPVELLPNIDFCALWRENISEKTRETIWKYLQLILFTIVTSISDSDSFGESAKLFEAINEDTFKEKLEETISGMQECFEGEEGVPDPTNIHDHISGMLDGKLGQFAREIAEETANEMDLDMETANSVGDVFQKLIKDPKNLTNLVKKVGSRLDDKLKTGDLKESELMTEASEMLNKMKDMPGFEQMFGKMAGGGKMNFGAMHTKLNQNMQRARQRERMQKRAEERRTESTTSEVDLSEATAKAEAMMQAVLRSEGLNSDGTENLVFSTGEAYEKSKSKPKPKKKRRRKKKN